MKTMYGPEEMLYPNKQLYRYNIRNGDEIIIDSKMNRFVSTSSSTSSIRSWRVSLKRSPGNNDSIRRVTTEIGCSSVPISCWHHQFNYSFLDRSDTFDIYILKIKLVAVFIDSLGFKVRFVTRCVKWFRD